MSTPTGTSPLNLPLNSSTQVGYDKPFIDMLGMVDITLCLPSPVFVYYYMCAHVSLCDSCPFDSQYISLPTVPHIFISICHPPHLTLFCHSMYQLWLDSNSSCYEYGYGRKSDVGHENTFDKGGSRRNYSPSEAQVSIGRYEKFS